jgi:molecular chaperone DnaK (HSP70)
LHDLTVLLVFEGYGNRFAVEDFGGAATDLSIVDMKLDNFQE